MKTSTKPLVHPFRWRAMQRAWTLAAAVSGVVAVTTVLLGSRVSHEITGRSDPKAATQAGSAVATKNEPSLAKGLAGQDAESREDSLEVRSFVWRVAQASDEVGARVPELAVQRRPPQVADFGRDEVRASIRGSYPQVRGVLARVSTGSPQAVLRRITFTKQAIPTDLDIQVEWWLPIQPK